MGTFYTDNPHPTIWQPAEGTCETNVEKDEILRERLQ
jgi:hypothetical protein